MRLLTVTMTGADETTDPKDLAALSERFPFVEWGFLVSFKKTGVDPRYPSIGKLHEFGLAGLRTSVHVCGRWAREVANREGLPVEAARHLVKGAKRVQVNLGGAVHEYPELFPSLRHEGNMNGIQIILQTPTFKLDSPHYKNSGFGDVVLLHDASGGAGISGEFEAPINDDFVGFAGGINPDNVLAKLRQIAAIKAPNLCWIDMESGVRTDDRFDLAKVESVLSAVHNYTFTDLNGDVI